MIQQWVYFIQAGADGPIKIGWAVNPMKRLSELQIGNHEVLRLIGTCLGGWDREHELHAELIEHRIRGEWYWPTGPVLVAIERCTAEGDDWDSPEQWERRLGMSLTAEQSWGPGYAKIQPVEPVVEWPGDGEGSVD